MLASRGITTPDGRALYQYRLRDSEFAELAAGIQFSSKFGIEHLTSMLNWDGIFVLYASEWWRREFCGQWGWEEIFKSVGIDFSELPVGSRNRLIERGLHRWHRQVRVKNGTRRFLGTIATEGGLPLHKLSETGGWLKYILQPVLRRHLARGHSISALIEAHSSFIPVSLRSQEISEILEDVVQAIVDLRATHDLAAKQAPIQWLDENSPDWRDNFPLPLDDESAKSLLAELVDTAFRAKVDDSTGNPFELERFLIRTESTAPELIAEIEIPQFVSLESIGLDADSQALPSTMEIEVFEPVGTTWNWCRALLTTFREKRVLKLSGRNLRLTGDDASKNLRVRFKSMGQSIAEVEVAFAGALEDDIPWLFKSIEGKWKLHGAASQSIRNDDGIVYCPNAHSITAADEASHVSPFADFHAGRLWNLRGVAICSAGSERFRFQTGGKESAIFYQLRGKQFPYESKPPRTVFIGKPDVVEFDGLTGRHKKRLDTRLLARKLGSADDTWQPIQSIGTGIYQVRVVDSDASVLFSQTIGLLDESYEHRLKPNCSDPCIGSLSITGIEDMQISCIADGTAIRRTNVDNTTRFDMHSATQPPNSVHMSLLASGQGRELLLTYPFPTCGAILFDSQDRLIPQGKPLHLDSLHGYRLKVFNDKTHLSERFMLTLSLIDSDLSKSDIKDIYVKKPMKIYGEYTELTISDWSSAVRSLFGVSKSLDAMVRVSLSLDADTLFHFDIRRYKHSLDLIREEGILELESDSLGVISTDDLIDAGVQAFRISYPEEKCITLEPQFSQGMQVGRWEFEPWRRKLGSWLIFPASNSTLDFRPVLWNVGEQPDAEDGIVLARTLSQAVSFSDQTQRIEQIRAVLVSMAENFDHESWGFIDSLWELTAHLPLTCFDVWQVASREPKFLAALLIKNHVEVVEKMEEEYPVIWELVSQTDWEMVLSSYSDKFKKELQEDKEFIDLLLDKAIKRIESHATSLQSMGKVLQGSVRGVHTQDMGLMTQPAEIFLKPMMAGQYQKLFQRQSESEWPEVLRPKLAASYNALPAGFRTIVSAHNHFQESVVYLPFVLAWNAIRGDDSGWCSSPAQVYKMQQIKLFDEDWFDVAFQFLTGWLSQQDNL